ncbi:hypothetical protein EVA_16404 [gut metagenome]|uniref:Uncharacterized protein n=1 Tax=gut metagenome TaxID=749906 RepID=J9G7Q2_9ZZZZ
MPHTKATSFRLLTVFVLSSGIAEGRIWSKLLPILIIPPLSSLQKQKTARNST